MQEVVGASGRTWQFGETQQFGEASGFGKVFRGFDDAPVLLQAVGWPHPKQNGRTPDGRTWDQVPSIRT
ncbi:hypothetical protein ABZV91_17775 [Nocardia sp. NPDC004568]|uniref:hypothetical protein n=1 Tax=Nocardia sp. NPDC004568 TaxID=3154551 RepID=UPI0033BDF54D